MNNETIGISAEIAIADTFNVPVTNDYRTRADATIIRHIKPFVQEIFTTHNISKPQKHSAQNQNPIDFVLENGNTLSVKTNRKQLGKVAPQIVGQLTETTYFENFGDIVSATPPEIYEEKRRLFKQISLEKTADVMQRYFEHLVECDYLIHFYNIIDATNHHISQRPEYIVLKKQHLIFWKQENFTFTQTVDTWNEGCTVKYCQITIGEFQAHKHIRCFKFRFQMAGIIKLIREGLL